MDAMGFKSIIDTIISKLNAIATTNPDVITSCTNGDAFELCVLDATKAVLTELKLTADILHTSGSHAFPDIILAFDDDTRYGIEVKSSSSARAKGWKINGNSVLGSTRDDSVIETYIIFGKTATLTFKARKYNDCVANVVVTHSPRYLIDMDISEGETFFEKSGIDYKTIVESDNPIALITSYFSSIGEKAWWLTESSPATVRMFSDLSIKEQYECFGYGLAHFPELLGNNSSKYKRFSVWLATEQSIVSPALRDDFSAGGRVDLSVNGSAYKELPQIFRRLLLYKDNLTSALDSCESEILCADWECAQTNLLTLQDKVDCWINIASAHIQPNQLPDNITPTRLLQDILAHSS